MVTVRATRKKKPSAAEQKAARHTQALTDCKQGKHTLRNTFRPREQVCIVCGVVFYCATCLKQATFLPHPINAYVFPCTEHRTVEVSR